MPPKKVSKATTRCNHTALTYSPSCHADEIGFKLQTERQRHAAAITKGASKSAKVNGIDPGTFTAPLILPDDDLALDPRHPPQSLQSWLQGKWRNEVTPERRTVYLAMPPEYNHDMEAIKKWAIPRQMKKASAIQQPKTKDVLEYLKAFYHGLPVKLCPSETLRFTSEVGDMDDMSKEDKKRQIIGLNFKNGYASKGIRTRPRSKGDYSYQMNLDDILTAAMWAVPEDAYALIMLVEHDMYEDEEDEFVCGRAYGGSRVAVITTARYNPVLDKTQGVEREHAWPASHCTAYINSMLDKEESQTENHKRKRAESAGVEADQKPLQAAIEAHHSLPSLEASPSPETLSGLWLGRVCRTASHELAHCFGLGHCIYYACSMQGSASIQEDARQPPYLCPVDAAKILHATAADAKDSYQAMLRFCENRHDVHLFAAYAAWIRGRLKELEVQEH